MKYQPPYTITPAIVNLVAGAADRKDIEALIGKKQAIYRYLFACIRNF